MKKEFIVLATISTFALSMVATTAIAAKPAPNDAPTVDEFTVATDSASPVPILTFGASDTDGTVSGYLVTESTADPSTNDPGWSATPQTEHATASTGSVQLCGWAKDDQDAISSPVCDNVNIPLPPVDADTLQGHPASDFALTGHLHNTSEVNGLDATLAAKADQTAVDIALATKSDINHGHVYGNITVVAKSGGEYTSPVDAINDLTNWCGTPSASNPCLIKVMPGVYDIGADTVWLSPYVDLKGSGENSTVIKGTPDLDANYSNYLVNTLGNNEIRSITLEANTAVGGNIITIGVQLKGNVKMKHTTVNVSGGDLSAGAYPVDLNGGNAEMVDVTLSATGGYNSNVGIFGVGSLFIDGAQIEAYGDNGGLNYAIWLYGASSAKIRNAVVKAYGNSQNMGLYSYRSHGTEIVNSDFEASFATIFINNDSEAKIANTKITGTNYKIFAQSGGLVKCFNNYDENYDAVLCP